MKNTEIVVLRLGHRPGRDDRMTTHVGLTARALGADRFMLAATDGSPLERINDVTTRFGGTFSTEQVDSARRVLRNWSGTTVHLTMYGLPIQEHLDDIREQVAAPESDLLIVVGAEKVPFDVYEKADWNIAVTNQPHSEVAGLAVFLERFQDGEALTASFPGGTHTIIPQATGKRVEERTEP